MNSKDQVVVIWSWTVSPGLDPESSNSSESCSPSSVNPLSLREEKIQLPALQLSVRMRTPPPPSRDKLCTFSLKDFLYLSQTVATSDDMADQELPASSFSIQCEKKKSHDGEGAARQFVFEAFPRGLGQIYWPELQKTNIALAGTLECRWVQNLYCKSWMLN